MSIQARAHRALVRGSHAWHRWRGPRRPRPPAPPRAPASWRTAPPDFVGVGAQKAGTSWWDSLIVEHPDVHRVTGMPKELHYFDRAWESPFGDDQAHQYAAYFPRPEGGIAGEWTPGYLIDFWTPDLIARAAPDARILILLRDPVERLRSALTHQLALSRAPLSHGDIQAAYQRGLYAPQLRRVLAAFREERIFVGQYEACRADPRGELARTYAFLGLTPFEPAVARLRGEVNPTTGHRFEPSPELHSALVAGYADDLAQLSDLVPGLDLSLWPTARELGLGEGPEPTS